MQTDENLIRKVKKMFEDKTGWGNSDAWTNQDFLQLSELIRDQTGVTLSHVTLKRVWGKVKYESLPNTHTLNTLAQFLGYDTWRDLAAKTHHADGATHPTDVLHPTDVPHLADAPPMVPGRDGIPPPVFTEPSRPRDNAATRPISGHHPGAPFRRKLWMFIPLLAIILLVLFFLHGQQPSPQSQDYAFSSRKVVTSGLPNSVIFDYDASRSPDDSVVIQQSWDTTRRVKVPRNGHQYTSVYYYPEFYHATLQVHNKIVKTHNLLIGSDGWLPLIVQDPVPVYFTKADAIHGGKISITPEQIRSRNIPLQPAPPTVLFCNVGDFGEIYTDHFVFETSLKNDYAEGSAACQLTRIYLLCEGSPIWVPLCAKGCVSNIDLYFTYFYTSGKREDLSAFGVNFNDYVKVRIESDSGKAKILINDHLAYTVPRHIIRSKIIGIDFQFQGAGSVDYVSLTNGKASYRDDFNDASMLPSPSSFLPASSPIASSSLPSPAASLSLPSAKPVASLSLRGKR
jgi:hypothetical protein